MSKFSNEVGAAIHVAPNATRILRDWACDFAALHPVQCKRFQVWDQQANIISTPFLTEEIQKKLDIHDDWLLTHRVDLHNALRAAASREIDGRKIDIRFASRVTSVLLINLNFVPDQDAEAGEVTLCDGIKFNGDLVVGADGIHSKSVYAVTGGEFRPKESTGQNCFRFLVPVSKIKANPIATALLDKIGLDGVHAFVGQDRRIVLYPCRNGELLNVAGIHPSGTTPANDASWLDSGNMEELLATFSSFGPELQELCRLAEDLKLWSLASRSPPSTFVKGKLALIGDAAHPTLPHQGQGGAQSFEDAAALAAVFPLETTPEQIPARLEMYNQVRYNHAVTVMMMSKTSDDRRAEMLDELRKYVPDAETPTDMVSYTWPSCPAREAQVLLGRAETCS
ncbi:monooxygenase [Penicillium argentinense]|uniref:Monooxygenase n=1 Tax=Penicillium argentinense TaxID=1131581 RepID=A0A9W9KA56_9EURO|nr:monooxygenase [Penicillium argentinense]KAJ5098206.1 monooxygenase [Penicillium argentinense]